jgi:hypothetical protein
MPVIVIEEGRCCLDCALVVANGEDSCDPAECPHGDIPQGIIGDMRDSEEHKPFRPCPGCGSTLAGQWPEYSVLGEAPTGTCCQCGEPAVRTFDGWKFCADHKHVKELTAS